MCPVLKSATGAMPSGLVADGLWSRVREALSREGEEGNQREQVTCPRHLWPISQPHALE